MSSIVRLEGVASDWQSYEHPPGHRIQYQPFAFSVYADSNASKFTELRVAHRPDARLPRAGLTDWIVSPTGLEVAFSLDTSKPDGLATVLAVKHGHLTGLSVGCEFQSKIMTGNLLKVFNATVEELSLTNDPANPRTWVAIQGCPRTTRKSLPTDPEERALLVDFLESLGIDSTPTTAKPITATRAAVVPSGIHATRPVVAARTVTVRPSIAINGPEMRAIQRAKPSFAPGTRKTPTNCPVSAAEKTSDDWVGEMMASWVKTYRHDQWLELQGKK